MDTSAGSAVVKPPYRGSLGAISALDPVLDMLTIDTGAVNRLLSAHGSNDINKDEQAS